MGRRATSCTKQSLDWKLDHLNACNRFKFAWPFDPDTFDSYSKIDFSNMLPRETELSCLIDKLFKPMSDLEFADINMCYKWTMAPCEDENGDLKPGATPWKSQAPCQVGSGKLICRYRLDGDESVEHHPYEFAVRVLEPFEQLRMIGWADEFYCHPAHVIWSLEDLELLVNLAGNAFTVFHWFPVYCSTLATWGKFLQDDPDQQLPAEVGDEQAEVYDSLRNPSSSESDSE